MHFLFNLREGGTPKQGLAKFPNYCFDNCDTMMPSMYECLIMQCINL